MNRPINSGKRVDGVDRVYRFSAESSQSTESSEVELIDRIDRFSVELSRFVRLDRFQGLVFTIPKATCIALVSVALYYVSCVLEESVVWLQATFPY